jgi:hypothetical protein
VPCRKNYRDLTAAEKSRFVAALHHVKSTGVVDQFASDHVTFFHAAHHSSHFLPWHREFLRRFELELRTYHPDVSIPYWNSTVDQSAGGPLWASDFLGPFDSAWNLNRTFGGGGLPAPGDVDTVLGVGTYDPFWSNLEGGIHNPPHNWVGGVMASTASPGDPVFYLHHCWIDMIWAQWQLRNPGAAFTSSGAGFGAGDAMTPWSTTPTDVLDHRSINSYDFLPTWQQDAPRATLVSPNVLFLHVPASETRMAAANVDLDACEPLQFDVDQPVLTSGPPGTTFARVAATVNHDPAVDPRARIWFTYRGTAAGDTASATARIRCTAAGFDETVMLTADTIARPTAAVALVLDRSNSMNFDSGIGPGIEREHVLRFSAPPAVDVVEDGHAIAVCSFDHDAHPGIGVTPVAGGRVLINGAISSYSPNPNGWTSIGEGILYAYGLLQPETSYAVRAMVVLTDGHENHGPHERRSIDSVAPTVVNGHVFAIGLGRGEALRPQKLQQLCNNRAGYMVLTGDLGPDSYYRLAKYYQQILAGVTNNEVVLDPEGWIAPGQEHRIPFWLTEADIDAKAILLTPAPWAIEVELVTPAGEIVDLGVAASHPMVDWDMGNGVALYRVGLPLPLGGPIDAHAGRWHAILRVGKRIAHPRALASVRAETPSAFTSSSASWPHGLRYSFNVHAYSNLRMHTTVAQSSYVPGALVSVRSVLTEYGVPITRGGSCIAEIERPDGSTATLGLTEVAQGEFEGSTVAALDGVYTMRVVATGRTMRGRPFTREQTRTAAVWVGGDREPPDPNEGSDRDGGEGHDRWCELVACLLGQRSVRKALERHDVDLDEVRKCLEHVCRPQRRRYERQQVPR